MVARAAAAFVALATGVVGMVVFASPAAACMCESLPQMAVARADAEVVFVGTPVSERDLEQPVDMWDRSRAVTFVVDRVYKGEVADRYEIITGEGGGDCGSDFEPGEPWLVFGTSRSNAVIAEICNGTARLALAEIPEAWGKGQQPQILSPDGDQSVSNEDGRNLGLIAAATALAAVAIWGAVALRRRTSTTDESD